MMVSLTWIKKRRNYAVFFVMTVCFIWSCGGPNDGSSNGSEETNQDSEENELGDYDPRDTLVGMNPDSLTYDQLYDRALTLWEIDFKEVDVPTSKGDAHVLVSGPENAKPVVLLHGMNASSTMWYPNIASLSENRRVYAIDFVLEPSKSELEGQIDDSEGVVDWYYEIVGGLELDHFDLIGASRGGWISMKLALKDTASRIGKIVLLSPAQTFIWIPPSLDLFTSLSFTISPDAEKLDGLLNAFSSRPENIDTLFVDQFFRASSQAEISKIFVEMRPFSSNELQSLSHEIYVIVGDDDMINSRRSLKKARKHISNVKTDVISKAGHFLSIDQAEKVNRKILEFLDD